MDHSPDIQLTKRQRDWLHHLQACEASGKGIASYWAGLHDERLCPHDGKLLAEIGEVISEQLDIIPANLAQSKNCGKTSELIAFVRRIKKLRNKSLRSL